MSLELAVQENTAAIRDLIAAIHANPVAANGKIIVDTVIPVSVSEAKPKAAAATPEPKVEAAAAVVEGKSASVAEEASSVSPSANAASASSPNLSPAELRDQCKDKVLALSKTKGKDQAIAVLAQFGAAKLPEVSDENLTDLHAALCKALGV